MSRSKDSIASFVSHSTPRYFQMSIDRIRDDLGLRFRDSTGSFVDRLLDWDSANPAAFIEWQRTIADERGNRLNEGTLRLRRAMYGKFLKFLYRRDVPLSVVTVRADDIEVFLTTLKGRAAADVSAGSPKPSASRNTSQRYVRLVSDVLDHLVALGLRESNPAANMLPAFNVRTPRRSGRKIVRDSSGSSFDKFLDWDSASPEAFNYWQRIVTDVRGNRQSERTLLQHDVMYVKFLKFLYGRDVQLSIMAVGAADIEAFLATLKGRAAVGASAGSPKPPASRSTSQRYVRLISDVLDHLVNLGVRESNPAADMLPAFNVRETWRSGRKLPECLDARQDVQLRARILSMPTYPWTSCRDRAMLAVYAGAGLSLFEGIHMRLANVDLGHATLVTPPTASGSRRPHMVPLAAWCVEPLATWTARQIEYGSDWKYLFPMSNGGGDPVPQDDPLAAHSVYLLIRSALDAVGFTGDDKGAAVLRNTYAMRNLAAGTSLSDLRSWMGLQTDCQFSRLAGSNRLWNMCETGFNATGQE